MNNGGHGGRLTQMTSWTVVSAERNELFDKNAVHVYSNFNKRNSEFDWQPVKLL